jgi:16S rRNA (adenine1518-N6/adenine1519-N6)-dimethyltransferase
MKPKKSLGQNFLTSGKAVYEIVNAGEIKKGETVLEIGPGKGALTVELLKSGGKIIAIEKDRELISFLEEKFKIEIKNKTLKLIEGDILDLDIGKIIKKNEKYKIIANIPYYITGAIIERFLSIKKTPELIVLLVQKEVAERIVAKNKKESILSLAVKFYGTPKIIYKVSAGSFFPKPKVDSAVLKITLNQMSKEIKSIEELYLNIVKKSFSHKRKMMLGNLKKEIKNIDWKEVFKRLNIKTTIRGEDLTEKDFVDIAVQVEKIK